MFMQKIRELINDRREKSENVPTERRKPKPREVDDRLHDVIDTFSRVIQNRNDSQH